jgi:hypothetical protein
MPVAIEGVDGADPSVGDAPPGPELGLEEIVREHISQMWDRVSPDSVNEPSAHAKLNSTDPEVKQRGEFELAILAQLDAARIDDPNIWLLEKSQFDGMIACLDGYGLPSIEELGRLSEEQQEALLEEFRLGEERMAELEDECWERSRIHAGKDEETALRLREQHQYYLSVAQAWVKANPDQVVPLPG